MIGAGNRFAHAAALAAAELPGQAYNPLFVCGPSGVGKTHLLQAVGNYVTLCVSGLAVRYASAETFTSHFLTALQTNRLPAFKQRYRTADVLLLDDVQFLEDKDRTAEEFLYTLEAALTAGAQIVISADRPPTAMPRLHTRSRTASRAVCSSTSSHPTTPCASRSCAGSPVPTPTSSSRRGPEPARDPRVFQRPLTRERARPRPGLRVPHAATADARARRAGPRCNPVPRGGA